MTALTHKENELHNRLIVAEFNLKQVETELRRVNKENKVLRYKLENGVSLTAAMPSKIMFIPAALEQAGYVKKREWVGLTDEETTELIQKWAGELVFEVAQALKEKNT